MFFDWLQANPGGLCAQVVCDWSIKEVNGGIFEGLLVVSKRYLPANYQISHLVPAFLQNARPTM